MKNISINRRNFLKSSLVATGAVASTSLLTGCAPIEFRHGVASGDPTQDAVVIWTRATPFELDKPTGVIWIVSRDRHCHSVVAQGLANTDASRDFTIKVDVQGLEPGTRYYYKFIALARHGRVIHSPIGQTETLPAGHTDLYKLAVFSCSNYPAGYFNVYKEAAAQEDVNAVLHLGDYIYEYGMGGYATEDADALDRIPNPVTEILNLGDYRKRYGQYRQDPDLQALHQAKPFICIWDDHEIANDTYKNGAENHNEGEGSFSDRKAAALQAYYEWLPIREGDSRERIFRQFDIGNLASLYMLDTRLIARDQQLDYANYIDPLTGAFNAPLFLNDLSAPDRSLLGDEQRNWLYSSMATSVATWQVLGQQILMGRMNLPAPLVTFQIGFSDYVQLVQLAQTNPELLTPTQQAILQQPSVPYNLDAWDGYAYERESLLETSRILNKNLISLAGDTHNAWANELRTLDNTPVGVEFATPGVSSPGLEEYLSSENPDVVAAGVTQLIEPLKYADTQHRGYMTVTLTHESAQADWQFVSTVKSKNYSLLDAYARSLKVQPGINVIEDV